VTGQTELSHEELQQTLDSIEIPACPAVVMQVMAEAQKDAPDLNALTKIIVSDVGMSAFAIKLALPVSVRATSYALSLRWRCAMP
jgi:HD-like signal output (HDOD) protein